MTAGGPLPWCSPCGIRAIGVSTRYGERCICTRCGAHSWKRAPLASARTHEARRLAHAAFDQLWQKHGLHRSDAYRRLAQQLGIPAVLCHMKLMDRETAEQVPWAVECIKTQIEDERLGLYTEYQLDLFINTL